MSFHSPKRILHVVGSMNRGGVETWLMHVIRHTDPARFRMDILVETEGEAAYESELQARGVRVLRCTGTSSPLSYARKFLRLMAEHGPYDVVHSHVHHYSGFVLYLAKRAGVSIRIAHSHNDLRDLMRRASPLRRVYYTLSEYLVKNYSTNGLAASSWAAASLFGEDWEHDPRWRVLYYGIDLSPLRAHIDGAAVRRELGISSDAFVIGHVGRFTEQKNHMFFVEIGREVAAADPTSTFVLVGDGPLRPSIERVVAEAGLSERFRFVGVRPDVLRLMKGCVDLFLFPSLHEGLGLVLVEAQAAGVPCICSDRVPPEADVVPGLVTRLSLSAGAREWAANVLQQKDRVRLPDQAALDSVLQSRFNLEGCLGAIAEVYAS